MLTVFVLLLFGGLLHNQTQALDATATVVSPPTLLAEIDVGQLKGDPVGLAWSEDGSSLYLRMAEYDRWRNERAHHYIVAVPAAAERGKAAAVSGTTETPAWAAAYWAWKSGVVAPGTPELRLDIDVQQRLATAVGSVSDGGLSQSRADPTRPQVATDASSAQRVTVVTVKMKGAVLMQSENESFVPGVRYGWAPAGVNALAYSDAKKRLVLIDRAGRKLEVAGTSDVLLPAWSPDGKQIVYLQKKDKKKYTLNAVTIEAK